jgi:D-ribose pyranase
MKEVGLLNRGVAKVVSEQGHKDLLMVTDAGFAIPKGLEVIDLSLAVNEPKVIEVLNELKKYYSVEKMFMAQETKDVSPSHFEAVSKVWGDNVEVEVVSHAALREMSKSVKAVIRTGDFTAFGNVVLVSGSGDRWYCEK